MNGQLPHVCGNGLPFPGFWIFLKVNVGNVGCVDERRGVRATSPPGVNSRKTKTKFGELILRLLGNLNLARSDIY